MGLPGPLGFTGPGRLSLGAAGSATKNGATARCSSSASVGPARNPARTLRATLDQETSHAPFDQIIEDGLEGQGVTGVDEYGAVLQIRARARGRAGVAQ